MLFIFSLTYSRHRREIEKIAGKLKRTPHEVEQALKGSDKCLEWMVNVNGTRVFLGHSIRKTLMGAGWREEEDFAVQDKRRKVGALIHSIDESEEGEEGESGESDDKIKERKGRRRIKPRIRVLRGNEGRWRTD